MSSTQVTESSRNLCLSIRVIEAKIYGNNGNGNKGFNCRVYLKLGPHAWRSSIINTQTQALRWEQSQSFDLSDPQLLSISLMHCPLLLGSIELGSTAIKIPTEPKKNTDWYELEKQGKTSARVLISFTVDEKYEPAQYSELLHYLELEREQIKFYKSNYLKKIHNIKVEKNNFRAKKKQFFDKINSMFCNSQDYKAIIEQRNELHQQKKLLIEMHLDVTRKLSQVSTGTPINEYADII
jgi:hypothetical protein